MSHHVRHAPVTRPISMSATPTPPSTHTPLSLLGAERFVVMETAFLFLYAPSYSYGELAPRDVTSPCLARFKCTLTYSYFRLEELASVHTKIKSCVEGGGRGVDGTTCDVHQWLIRCRGTPIMMRMRTR